ncbi:MAG: hypothetical protein ACRDSK_13750 [Actinophytocola sp.]|uniref:hypothetical protein n=1 Tax=Actinophytocola sp. TaxID=1872138 RepID=UPI003D6B8E67
MKTNTYDPVEAERYHADHVATLLACGYAVESRKVADDLWFHASADRATEAVAALGRPHVIHGGR